MVKQKIIIDCDPGHDDAIALLLSCYSDKLDLLAVTTVAGNQTIEKTSRNALNLLNFFNRNYNYRQFETTYKSTYGSFYQDNNNSKQTSKCPKNNNLYMKKQILLMVRLLTVNSNFHHYYH